MLDCLKGEISFRTSRSSGPGGQHVNKTESRVELLWNLRFSLCLDEQQKALLAGRIGHRLSDDGTLCWPLRSTVLNIVTGRRSPKDSCKLVQAGLRPVKKRRPTKPTRCQRGTPD